MMYLLRQRLARFFLFFVFLLFILELAGTWTGSPPPVFAQSTHPAQALTTSNWGSSLAAANLVKTDLSAANYQYPPLGNGGLDLLAGPTGFTDQTPTNAAYAPDVYYDYWWNNSTSRVNPFIIQGGYASGGTVNDGTISSFNQTLDVASGTLTTTLGLTPCDSCSSLTSTRTEFVTPAGVLVIQVADTQTNTFAVKIAPHAGYTLSYTGESNGLAVTSSASGQNALGIAVTVSGSDSIVDTGDGLVEAQVAPNQPVTFYIAARGLESSQPAQDAYNLASQAQQQGYSSNQSANDSFWSAFWNQSSINVPDSGVMKWYIRSEYYLGAFMNNTAIPFGCWGPRKEGYNGGQCMEYDLIFPDLAMLTANQSATTAPVASWVESTLPAAQALAPSYIYNGGPTTGAKYPVISSWNGQVSTAASGNAEWEAFPSANAALVDLLQAQYSNDSTRLTSAKQVLQAVTQYQLDNSAQVASDNNQWLSQKFLWQWGASGGTFQQGAGIEQGALQWSLNEAGALGVGPASWATDANNVYLPIAFDSARQQQVMIGYAGDTPGISNSFFPMMMPLYPYTAIDPSNPLFWPTYMNIASSNDINYTFNRGWAATVAAMGGNGDEALAQLDRLIPEDGPTDVNGGGVTWDDTYYSECNGASFGCYGQGPANTPEVGANGTMMLGTQHMLFDGSSLSTIKLFPALPVSWEQAGVSFQNLAANGDLSVSANYSESSVGLTVQNNGSTTATRTVQVRMPSTATGVSDAQGVPITGINGRFAQLSLTLAPGASQSVTLTPTSTGSWVSVDDSDPAVQYSGSWSTSNSLSSFYDNTAHYSNSTGASVQYTFTGTALRIIGDRNSDHGQVRISIDGQVEGDYDTWAPSESAQHVLFEIDGLAPRNHTVQLLVTGLSDQYSSNSTVTLDELQYLSGGTTSQQTIVDDGAASYSGNWSSGSQSGYYDGTAHWSNTPGASVSYSFTGTGIEWIGAASPAHGLVNVQIDNGNPVIVDTYAPTIGDQAVLFGRTGLTNGPHTITITLRGDKNPAASDMYTDVDAFVYDTGSGGATGVDDNAGTGFTYTGSWSSGTSLSGYYQGTAHYSNTPGASVQYTFTGTAISWYGAASPAHGMVSVSIDNGNPVTVDTYAPTIGNQSLLFNRTGLSYGPHTITITLENAKNSAASDMYTDIDAFATA